MCLQLNNIWSWLYTCGYIMDCFMDIYGNLWVQEWKWRWKRGRFNVWLSFRSWQHLPTSQTLGVSLLTSHFCPGDARGRTAAEGKTSDILLPRSIFSALNTSTFFFPVDSSIIFHHIPAISHFFSGSVTQQLPSGNLTVCYWKLPFIVDCPIKNGDFP
jgi:hypothetical protein